MPQRIEDYALRAVSSSLHLPSSAVVIMYWSAPFLEVVCGSLHPADMYANEQCGNCRTKEGRNSPCS
jgi:hypothetical protein